MDGRQVLHIAHVDIDAADIGERATSGFDSRLDVLANLARLRLDIANARDRSVGPLRDHARDEHELSGRLYRDRLCEMSARLRCLVGHDRLSCHDLLPFGQWHLNASNGSRQVRQRCNDLHAVEPNSLISSVSALPQCGQTGCSWPNKARREAVCAGGAIPNAASLRRAASLSQSVVQAGDSRVWTRALTLARASAVWISSMIMFMAGQPE